MMLEEKSYCLILKQQLFQFMNTWKAREILKSIKRTKPKEEL